MRPATEPVWIVDDDESIRWVLAQALNKEKISSKSFCSADSALESFQIEHPRIVVTDIRMKGMNGLDFLDEITKQSSSVAVIVMTAFSDLDTTVDSFQRGAREHLPKPFDIDDAVNLIRQVMSESDVESDSVDSMAPTQTTMIGESPPMQEVFRAIGRLSKSDINVLITGESGTGKELVACALYENSIRRTQPLVAINAAAIPVDLLESELFGHERGAFTGANQRRIGRFEQAHQGTLFLDEIGDMPHDLQSRLLRVMSEGKFYRVGGVNQISVNVRIIAATNQNLEELVKEKRFRTDLFHRLNVVRIALAPLRDRSGDIPLLIRHFLRRSAKELNTEEKVIANPAMEYLTSFHWPGNIREIENFCRSVTVMTPAKMVTIQDLPPEIRSYRAAAGNDRNASNWESRLQKIIEEMLIDHQIQKNADLRNQIERTMIKTVLNFTGWSKQDTAKILGWSRNTMTRKVKNL